MRCARNRCATPGPPKHKTFGTMNSHRHPRVPRWSAPMLVAGLFIALLSVLLEQC